MSSHLAPHLLRVKLLMMLRQRHGQLSLKGPELLQRDVNAFFTPLPVLHKHKLQELELKTCIHTRYRAFRE